jgi:hypothetical protein
VQRGEGGALISEWWAAARWALGGRVACDALVRDDGAAASRLFTLGSSSAGNRAPRSTPWYVGMWPVATAVISMCSASGVRRRVRICRPESDEG